jgi:hypothetical protein
LAGQRQAKTVDKTKQFAERYYITSHPDDATAVEHDIMARSPPPGSAMKRFVIAGIFFVLGFIILGVATSVVMSGPDKPSQPPRPAANADEANKRHGAPGPAQQAGTSPQSQNGSGRYGMSGGTPGGGMSGGSGKTTGASGSLTQVPGTIVPLTTNVPGPSVRPGTASSEAPPPQVPVLPQTDESSSRGTQQSTAK